MGLLFFWVAPMTVAKIGEQYQIVIPLPVREALGLQPGDSFDIRLEELDGARVALDGIIWVLLFRFFVSFFQSSQPFYLSSPLLPKSLPSPCKLFPLFL